MKAPNSFRRFGSLFSSSSSFPSSSLVSSLEPSSFLLLLLIIIIILPKHVQSGKAYPLGCANKLPSYYDYDNNYPWPPPSDLCSSSDNYWLVKRLGSGKFSEVFEALQDDSFFHQNHSSSTQFQNRKETTNGGRLVVIKCLKPVASRKVRREILVLTRVEKLPNMVQLLGVVTKYQNGDCNHLDPKSKNKRGISSPPPSISNPSKASQAYMPALVMEHAGKHSRWFCHGVGKDDYTTTTDPPKNSLNSINNNGGNVYNDHRYLSIREIKYFLFHLLIALDSLHSRGIMHRDVKPRNVLINRRNDYELEEEPSIKGQRRLMLIDLGLADFYIPGTRYNVRVASRHYKAPELLVGDELYDYAVDLWGAGCILAGLLFHKEPFFRGKDNIDQLLKIANVLGTDDLISFYCNKRNVPLTPEIQRALFPTTSQSRYPIPQPQRKSSWIPFLPKGITFDKNYREGLDLLDKLLVYDHEKRLNAREAMGHVFFDEVREEIEREMGIVS